MLPSRAAESRTTLEDGSLTQECGTSGERLSELEKLGGYVAVSPNERPAADPPNRIFPPSRALSFLGQNDLSVASDSNGSRRLFAPM